MTPHTLVLLRHGKAGSPLPGMPDADRSLVDQGRADAEAVGQWLAKEGLFPDLVLCSPARRTRETWDAVDARLRAGSTGGTEVDPTVTYVRQLYSDGVDALLGLLAGISDEIDRVLVVGHNPTVSVVSAVLDPDGGSENGLKTASLAVHTIPSGQWADCRRGAAPLVATHVTRGIPNPCRSSES
ncbi:MAG: histidine phosphatase family protein [Micromonosporaceae bacterium]|nr:histidine phosphatase family protein [Micromonosporaceae bacterium]